MRRDGRLGGVLVGVGIALGLFGYFVGTSGAPTDAEVAKARTSATARAEKTADKKAYRAGRREGRRAGREEGRTAGARKGTSDGKKRVEQVQAGTAPAPGTGGTGTGTGQDYSNAPLNGSTTTPQTGTPQGKQLLNESPDCKNVPPPPPGYDGPVQC